MGSEAVSERPLVDSVPREGLVAVVGFLCPVELVPPAAEEIEPRAWWIHVRRVIERKTFSSPLLRWKKLSKKECSTPIWYLQGTPHHIAHVTARPVTYEVLLWGISTSHLITRVMNSLQTWHDKCNICWRYCIYHVKFNVCLVTKPLGVFSSETKWLTLRFCFWRWIMWKMYNETIIEFGFSHDIMNLSLYLKFHVIV